MADQWEVEAELARVIAEALYPDGVAADSAIGTVCRVYRGVPVPSALADDLEAGIAHVTVLPVEGSAKDTTRFSSEWQGSTVDCPLSALVYGDRVRFEGEPGPGVVAGVQVDGQAFAWRVPRRMTAGVVAAVLADMVRAVRPAELVGTVVHFPGGTGVLARAVSDGVGGRELRRQSERFRVSLWCPTPTVRDRLGAFVDLSLAGMVFLDVGGWGCRISASGGKTIDDGADARAWRRELVYEIEYPTVLAQSLPAMLFGAGSVNGAGYLGS